jgi:U4/U6 small nuclear ribonucleoprotein PRP31
VTATTTNGRKLTDVEINRVNDACKVAVNLNTYRQKLLDYVKTRMVFIAPNLTAILGSGIAAKLMGISGGLTNLSKIPACNILILGKTLKTNTGLSSVYMGKHCGVVYQCELVANTPPDIQRKAARIVSAKCAMASRIDSVRESTDGSQGMLFRLEIQKRIDLLVQPLPSKRIKALPLPKEVATKRRGGKRARRAKERMAATSMQKAQNRMAFGEQEAEIGFGDEETVGLGLIGGSTGKVRAAKAEIRKGV